MRSASHKFELAFHLKSFQNIGIRQACVVQLRTVIYQAQSKNNISSKPYEIIKTCSIKDNPMPIKQPISHKIQDKWQKESQHIRDNRDIRDSNHSQDTTSNEASIEDQIFISPKIYIRSMDKVMDLDLLCLFKGEISIPEEELFINQIQVYCELIWYRGKEVQVIGSWKGFSKFTNFCSFVDIYFFTPVLACSIHATAHCLLTQITLKNEQKLSQLTKSPIFYSTNSNKADHILHKPTTLYDACIDPLIQSLVILGEWIQMLHGSSVKKKGKITKDEATKFKWASFGKIGDGTAGSKGISGGQVVQCIKADFHAILTKLYPMWKEFLTLFQENSNSQYFTNLTQKYYKELQSDHWQNRIIITNPRTSIKTSNTSTPTTPTSTLQFQCLQQHQSVIKLSHEDLEILCSPLSPSSKKQRIVVLVHGFQASSFDMDNIAMYIKFRNPDCYVVTSQANQGMTESNIQDSGHRLAIQVKNFINFREIKDFAISFLGHSLGGLIVRAALRYLQLYKHNFQCFISICSPHMGYLYHTSKIVTTSLWVMNQVKKDQSMIELAMSDNKDLEKCYLYELSERQELTWFKTVILMGSKEDQYVPFSSALLQNLDFLYESQSAKIYKTMVKNILKGIHDRVVRLEIVFNDRVKDLSGFIGRTAHIKVLSFLPVIDLYCHLIAKRI